MQTLGMASPEQADNFAVHAVAQDATATAADVVAKAMASAKAPRLQPTSNLKRKRSVAEEFAALPLLDIRKLVYDAGISKTSVEAELDIVGHLFHLDNWGTE